MKPLIAAVCIGLALAFIASQTPIFDIEPVSTYSDSDGA
jgi:hypothetical protein